MRATYIGGPSVLLEVGGVRLLTDPTFDPAGSTYGHLEKLTGPALSPDELPPIDAVLLSHDQHADNLDAKGREFLAGVTTVLTTTTGSQRIGPKARGLASWESATISGPTRSTLTITATPARHGPPGCEQVMGEVIGFVLQHGGSGDAVYVSGDTVWYDGIAEVGRRFSVGVAILHLGDAHVEVRGPDRLTMNAEDGVEAARALRAHTIIPVHYEGWAHFTQSPARAREIFATASLPGRVLWLEPGVSTLIDAARRTTDGSEHDK